MDKDSSPQNFDEQEETSSEVWDESVFTWSDFDTKAVFGETSSQRLSEIEPPSPSPIANKPTVGEPERYQPNTLEVAKPNRFNPPETAKVGSSATFIEGTTITFCPRCKYQLPSNAKFCGRCGMTLASENVLSSVQPNLPRSPAQGGGTFERLKRWIDKEDAEDALSRAAAEQARPRRQAEQFIVTIARAIGEVMQAEAVPLPPDQIVIPPEYIVFLSEDDDREWQGMKRRALEQDLYHVLGEHARDLAGKTKLATASFSVELRVEKSLSKGEVRVRHSWEEGGRETAIAPPVFSRQQQAGTSITEKFENPKQKAEAPKSQTEIVEKRSDSRFAPGAILSGRYRVEKFIGRGGFGDIYTVVNIENYLPDERILKLLRFDENNAFSGHNADGLQSAFQSQFKAWKVLSEKEPDFIVRLHSVKKIEWREGGNLRRDVGIFMEYMRGGNLWGLVKSWGGKPQAYEQLRELLRLLVQVCRSVQIIHKYKLIHCDIKPQNFLLDAAKRNCKVCDFELLTKMDAAERERLFGTPQFMSPEAFRGEISVASDIYALGVTFFLLLSGEFPFADDSEENDAPDTRKVPLSAKIKLVGIGASLKSLTELNPLVPPALERLVRWCLEPESEHRPLSVEDLLNHLLQLGIADEESNFAPYNLARLMLAHLSLYERKMLINYLRKAKYRSVSELPEHQEQDMIEEFCYTASPHEILREHCGGAILPIAESLNLNAENRTREELIPEIVAAIGFLPGKQTIHGLEAIRDNLENLAQKLERSDNLNECCGYLKRTFSEIENAVDLLISFYGQMLHGTGMKKFLSRQSKGKPTMTLGQKIGALTNLCTQEPAFPLSEKIERVFDFPLVASETLEKLSKIGRRRNDFEHGRVDLTSLYEVQNFGQEILPLTVEAAADFARNRYAPRLLQVTALQHDIYGRHFYEGLNEKGHVEKIFTTLGLRVGELYLFFPFTNPARINPLIFPFEKSE